MLMMRFVNRDHKICSIYKQAHMSYMSLHIATSQSIHSAISLPYLYCTHCLITVLCSSIAYTSTCASYSVPPIPLPTHIVSYFPLSCNLRVVFSVSVFTQTYNFLFLFFFVLLLLLCVHLNLVCCVRDNVSGFYSVVLRLFSIKIFNIKCFLG